MFIVAQEERDKMMVVVQPKVAAHGGGRRFNAFWVKFQARQEANLARLCKPVQEESRNLRNVVS